MPVGYTDLNRDFPFQYSHGATSPEGRTTGIQRFVTVSSSSLPRSLSGAARSTLRLISWLPGDAGDFHIRVGMSET
jgi:hypothetical protein